jgi:hypothetical protein
MTTDAKYAFIESFFDGLDEIVKLEYDDYLYDAIDSIDVYGLGFTLQYILNCFKRHNAVSQDFFNLASSLFSSMYESNPDNRELDIYELLNEYESILLGTGILARLNKRFNKDNELVDSAPMPSPIMRKAKKEVSSKPLSAELESIAYMDAAPKVSLKPSTKPVKACPPGKEINPKTGRCIKQCASNETRNAQGRCVKQTRRIRSSSSSSRTRSSSRNRNIKDNLLNQIFPELKKTTKEEKDANPTLKINKTFPYENRSKSKTKTRSNK